jgi:hypothetical protein
MSKLDTYKSIEHYAINPRSRENILSLELLRHRTELDAIWLAYSMAKDADDIEPITNLYMGGRSHTEEDPLANNKVKIEKAADLREMPVEDSLKIYRDICASVGISIDPDALLDKRGKDARS